MRRPGRSLMSETTVATRVWMLTGKEPPIPAASDWTLAAAAFVALYQLVRPLAWVRGAIPAVSSRSSSSACTRSATCCPRLASCDTRPNSFALLAADATCSPPKTRPMSRARTITAISRVDTGQFCRVSRRPPVEREAVASVEYWLESPVALATAWFPIADVLAGYALFGMPPHCRARWTNGLRRYEYGMPQL